MAWRVLGLAAGALLLVTLLITRCSARSQHRDMSGEKPYADWIGRACEVKVPLRAHGVMGFDPQDRRTQWVSVWNPGFRGPEVTFVEYLQEGTVLQVMAARECSNCPFDDRPEIQVSVQPLPESMAGVPVFVQADMFREGQVQCRPRSSGSFTPPTETATTPAARTRH